MHGDFAPDVASLHPGYKCALTQNLSQRPVEGAITTPATAATAAIIRKKCILSMLLQKLPSQPAMKLPMKLVAEPYAHHHRHHAGGRRLRHQREPDRRKIELADGDDDEIGEEPQPARVRRAACLPGGAHHDEVGERDAEAAERHLVDARRLRAAPRLPRPQRHDERREGEDHERIEGLEPGGRDLAVPEQEIDGAVGVVVRPQRDRVALLLVGGPEQRVGQEQQQERDDGAPLDAGRACRDTRRWPWRGETRPSAAALLLSA